MELFRLRGGNTPLLVSVPHAGTEIPDALRDTMTREALELPDTDWHVGRLYDFAPALGATVIEANCSRYVIDLNRDPGGKALYPDADNTGLCPAETFDRASIHRPDRAPDDEEIARRLRKYYRPYHAAIMFELGRMERRFGYALLYDAHSIRSRVPRFFEGELPSLNIGAGGGITAHSGLAQRVSEICASAQDYTTVLDGRFKGGYITRQYGDPARHIHALQMEHAQKTYMDESPPYKFIEEKADRLRPLLRRVLEEMLAWGRETYG